MCFSCISNGCEVCFYYVVVLGARDHHANRRLPG